jgi:hypothetical protein
MRNLSFLSLVTLAVFAPFLALAQAVAPVVPVVAPPAEPGAFMSLFMQIVVPALFTALAAVVTWGGKKLIDFIDAKTKNEAVAGILGRLVGVVQTVVLDVNGTVKAGFIDAAKDGTITATEAAQIKAIAIAKVKEHLGTKGIAEVVTALGIAPAMIDAFIGSHLEAAIEGTKDRTTPAIDPAADSANPK